MDFWCANNANSVSFCDKSGRLATRFVDGLKSYLSRSWLRNPDFSSKILEFALLGKCRICTRFCESQNLGENLNQKPIKSFCYFWLIPKVESPLPLNPNLPNNVDSANCKIS